MNKLNKRDVVTGLKMLLDSTPATEVFIRERIQEQIDWFDKPINSFQMRDLGGAHLGAVRNWIQWNCLNGSAVTWGSNELLQSRHNWTPEFLEDIACKVAAGVINEMKGL